MAKKSQKGKAEVPKVDWTHEWPYDPTSLFYFKDRI